ncbi:hypothetical protein IAR55_001456 [Kwoniella newhampshirensis]|uniref:SANT domain-containing protein n=1 Tax=Kwoniella newhampshirensis TaxID=1651941 RepID=A0AAW0Z2B4_9TREE
MSSSSYSPAKPPSSTPGPPARAGPSRWDAPGDDSSSSTRDREERTNGHSRSGEPSAPRPYAIPPWQNRPPPRQTFRPHPAAGSGSRPRSHSPSPPRRGYDRDRDRCFDVRDRPSVDPGRSGDLPPSRRASGFSSAPTRDRGPERDGGWGRDDRRWTDRRDDRDRDRERDRERFRDDLPRSVPPRPSSSSQVPPPRFHTDRSLPPRSPPSAPRGPRALAAATPPAYSTPRIPSGPRSIPQYNTPARDERERSPFQAREASRTFDRPTSSAGGPGPSSIAFASSQNVRRPSTPPETSAVPRAPRSMRGSSSPVETRRTRDYEGSSSVPASSIALPDVKADSQADADADLEEGEVVSPVQSARQPSLSWSYKPEDRDRRSWQQPRDRDRDRWERDREWERKRERDRRRAGSPSPPPQWTGKRNSEESWGGSGARGRRRSMSNPTRRRGPSSEEHTHSSRSPARPEPARESPEQSREASHAEQEALRLGHEGQADMDQNTELLDRPPTPPVPPPVVTSEDTPVESAPFPVENSTTGTLLEPPVVLSRPDTPALPPPVSDSGAEPDVAEQSAQEDSIDMEGVTDRPVTPALPPPSPTLGPKADSETVPAVEDVHMASPPKQAEHDVVSEAAGAEDVAGTDDDRVVPTAIDGEQLSNPLILKENALVPENHKSALRVSIVSPVQQTDFASVPSANEVSDLPALSPSRAAPSSVQSSELQTDQQREHSPPTPMAPTSPPDSAVTPALHSGATSVYVEIVHEQQDSVSSPASSAPVSQGKPDPPVTRNKSSLAANGALSSPSSPPLPPRRVTIAERRAVHLPPTNASLASPFGDKFAGKDPMPTADSTDVETEAGPKTADIDGRDSPLFEDPKEARLIAAIKSTQSQQIVFHGNSILAWNVATAPEDSSRILALDDEERELMLKDIVQPLEEQQRSTARLVAIAVSKEHASTEEKIERLKAEYLELDEEWREHCSFLDSLMEKRGPPPADLFSVPGAMLPVVTPGPVAPTTPIPEDLFNSRGNRRRGAGDAVTTEAEFEMILAGLADTAAKDPNFRASKTAAVVPDMLLDEERNLRYDDDNDLVTDPLAFYDFAGNAEPIWTPEERAQFVRRYMAYPKQFGRVSDGISNKTASDCVLYYYRTKKEVDYKGMLASKRGGGKKKSIPIKKGGKSAALLADLEKKKPTVSSKDESSTPARNGRGEREESIVPGTSARKGRPSASASGTPSEGGGPGRRRKAANLMMTAAVNSGNDDDDQMDSTATSRAGSEDPSSIVNSHGKAKMRMTVKTVKRPRISSVSDAATAQAQAVPSGLSATIAVPASADSSTTTPVVKDQPLDPDVAQTELLPPVKRAGKRRKVVNDPADPTVSTDVDPIIATSDDANTAATATVSLGDPASAPGVDKPARRSATNSYWSVEEKRRVKELVAIHGIDVKVIASQLKGKSERQVGNFLEGHKSELIEGRVGTSVTGAGRMTTEDEKNVNGMALQGGLNDTFKSTAQPTRTIYDTYPSFMSGPDRYEPRLGMFPPSPPQAATAGTQTPGGIAESPIKPISRPGGMRISALLNDDPPAAAADVKVNLPASDSMDAASDGTIDERDMDGVIRPSPRSNPPVPATQNGVQVLPSTYSRYEQHRPDLDRYRSSTSVSSSPAAFAPTPSNSTWNGASQPSHPDLVYPHRPATANPAAPRHRSSWDAHAQSHSHPHPHSHSYSHPHPGAHRTNSYSSGTRYEQPIPGYHHQQLPVHAQYSSERAFPHPHDRDMAERYALGHSPATAEYGTSLPSMNGVGHSTGNSQGNGGTAHRS